MKPTFAPTINPKAPGCPESYDPKVNYSSGMDVEQDNMIYKCRNWPEGGYCNAGPNFAPGSKNSNFGWIKVGSCDGTLKPTSSPVHIGLASGGCNFPYRASDLSTYTAGTRVEYNDFIFECKSDIHLSNYCKQSNYAPDGPYWSFGWNKIGWCDGTLKPTAAPTPKPTATPTAKPTAVPTAAPTAKPTATPTAKPSAKPTAAPTAKPTATPTAKPSMKPTAAPTAKPTTPTP